MNFNTTKLEELLATLKKKEEEKNRKRKNNKKKKKTMDTDGQKKEKLQAKCNKKA